MGGSFLLNEGKTIIISEIDEMIDTYCEGCFLKKQLVKEQGKTAAHKFCITGCTIGDQLRFLGNELNKFTK